MTRPTSLTRRTLLQAALASACLPAQVVSAFAETVAASEAPVAVPNAFGLQTLAVLATPERNTLCSPLSLDTAVALSRAGVEALSVDPEALSQEDQMALWADQGLRLSNAVWLDTGITASDSATTTLREDWDVAPVSLDLQAEGTQRINAWVDEATDGMIPHLVSDIPGAVSLIVTSALVFKDDWANGFDSSLTFKGRFTMADDTEIEHPFLLGQTKFDTWSTEQGIVAILPFAKGMQVLLHLPNEGDQDSPTSWQLDPNQSERRPVSFPKIDLSQDNDLTMSLSDLGIEDAIAEGLSTLATQPQAIGPVLQAVKLKVDETGAEAAAATAIMATRALPLPPENPLVFDRPFNLYIFAPDTGDTVIAAHIADPRS